MLYSPLRCFMRIPEIPSYPINLNNPEYPDYFTYKKLRTTQRRLSDLFGAE